MPFEYRVRRTNRSRKIKIGVDGGEVVVTAPTRVSEAYLEKVVLRHSGWIEKALLKQQKLVAGVKLKNEVVDRKEFLNKVKLLVFEKHQIVSKPAGGRINKVSVRKMRSRWGSCSREGNISINLLLGHLPDELLIYVVVHELCHLVHHNHSKNFWSLVAAHLPDHKLRKRELRRYGHLLKASAK